MQNILHKDKIDNLDLQSIYEEIFCNLCSGGLKYVAADRRRRCVTQSQLQCGQHPQHYAKTS